MSWWTTKAGPPTVLSALLAATAGCGRGSTEAPPDDRLTDIVELQVGDEICARDVHGSVFCWVGDQPAQRVEGIDDAVRIGSPLNPLGMHLAVLRSGEVVTWHAPPLKPDIVIEGKAPYQHLGHRGGYEAPEPEPLKPFDPMSTKRVATKTGIFVDPPDIFADTGCYFFRGLFSCPEVAAPNYDRLEWWYREGVVDIGACGYPAFALHGPVDERGDGVLWEPMICLLYGDGRLECTVDQLEELQSDSFDEPRYERRGHWIRRPGRTILVELPGRPIDLVSRQCPGVWVRYEGGIARVNHDGSLLDFADSVLPGEVVSPGPWVSGDGNNLNWFFMRAGDDTLVVSHVPKVQAAEFVPPGGHPEMASLDPGLARYTPYDAVPFTAAGGDYSTCILTASASVACLSCPSGGDDCLFGHGQPTLRYVRGPGASDVHP